VITWQDRPIHLKIISNDEEYEVISGQNDPLQGWYFPEFNKLEEAPVFILLKKDSECEFITRIEVCTNDSGKIQRKKIEKTISSLETSLFAIERRQLAASPFPVRWKIKR